MNQIENERDYEIKRNYLNSRGSCQAWNTLMQSMSVKIYVRHQIR